MSLSRISTNNRASAKPSLRSPAPSPQSPAPMPLSFQELAGSPRVRILESGKVVAEREFKVAWDDWVALVNELRGLYFSVATKGAALVAPAYFPGNPALRVVSIAVAPFDDQSPDGNAALVDLSAGMNSYASGARVHVEYGLIDRGSDRRKPPHPPETF